MRYLSPASLPDGSLINLTDKKSLVLLRKKLLAELELNGGEALELNGQRLTKNDILTYFESLENDTILRYHEAISKDKTLVRFLETSRLTDRAVFAQTTLYTNAAFLQWISPYFYTAFSEYVYRCLENTDETGLRSILDNPLLLTEYDRQNAWLKVMQMLEDNIAQLERYQQQDKKKRTLHVGDIDVLITTPLTQMILLLPETAFAHVRDKYAFFIMQVCIFTYNNDKNNRDHIDPWMENAKTLAASDQMAEEIASKHEEIKKLREKGRRSVMIRAAFLVAFVLLKFVPFNNTPDSTPAKFTKFTYDGVTIHNARELDSVMQKHRSTDSTLRAEPQLMH